MMWPGRRVRDVAIMPVLSPPGTTPPRGEALRGGLSVYIFLLCIHIVAN